MAQTTSNTQSTPVFERKKKTLPLPPSINATKSPTLKILHNHPLLARVIYRELKPTSYKYSPSGTGTTVFTLVYSQKVKFKVTFTNHEDGVSVLEEADLGIITLVTWSVVQPQIQAECERGGKQEQSVAGGCCYVLEESFSVQGSRVMWWLSTVFQDRHPSTGRLMGISEAAAAAEKAIVRLKVG